MRALGLLAAAAAVLFAGGCDADAEKPGGPLTDPTPTLQRPAGMPSTVPLATGLVRTRTHLTVMAAGRDDPVLCTHGTSESSPPTCAEALPLAGFVWPADVDPVGGVRYADFALTGRFDGTTLAVTEARRWDGASAADPFSDPDGYATVCVPPPGGWRVLDPATTTPQQVESLPFDAEKLPGYNAMWFDDSRNPAPDDAGTPLEVANDPAYLTANVLVSRDVAGARRALRKLWGGALCVRHTRYDLEQLQQIQDDVGRLPGALSVSGLREHVEIEVLHDDGSFQRWADRRYGRGTVRVFSFLEPVVSSAPAPGSG